MERAVKKRRAELRKVDAKRARAAAAKQFKRDAAYQSVYFVSEADQMFGEIASVLTGNTGNQSSFHGDVVLYWFIAIR